jgi:hypothetical protein
MVLHLYRELVLRLLIFWSRQLSVISDGVASLYDESEDSKQAIEATDCDELVHSVHDWPVFHFDKEIHCHAIEDYLYQIGTDNVEDLQAYKLIGLSGNMHGDEKSAQQVPSLFES